MVSTHMGASLNLLTLVDLGMNHFTCNNCTLIEFKKWILALDNNNVTLTEYVTLSIKRILTCSEPFSLEGHSVRDVDFNPQFCLREPKHFLWVLMHVYRYQLTYLCHLVKIMKKRSSSETGNLQDVQFNDFVCYR